MKIAKRIFIIGILLTVFEVLCFYLTIKWADFAYPFSWKGVAWGIYREFSFIAFIAGIGIINLAIGITKKLYITIPIAILIIGLYFNEFHSAFDYRPYRVLMREILITGLAIMSFTVSIIYNKNQKKLNSYS